MTSPGNQNPSSASGQPGLISLDDVRAAAARLSGVAHRTPVITSRTLDRLLGGSVLLKAEVFQRTGSFKFRGAFNKLASMTPRERDGGVLAFSSGNHAQAVALAASLFKTPATIVMPDDAPAGKRAATEAYGAEVVSYDRYAEDRELIGRRLADQRNLALIPPFDDLQVMAGQGTAGLELAHDAGPLDLLLAPVSGGGLIAGCAVAVKGIGGGTRVIGVEPETADDYRQSLAAGRRISIPVPRTVADALQVPQPGELTFAHNRALLDAVVTVSDAELIGAMRFCHERLKLVVEPGGAAGVAALLSGAVRIAPRERVGVILSGGNIDPERFCSLLDSISS